METSLFNILKKNNKNIKITPPHFPWKFWLFRAQETDCKKYILCRKAAKLQSSDWR